MTKTPGEVEPFKPIPCVRARAFRLRNSPNQREGRLSDRRSTVSYRIVETF
jgi:hypothetical protein